MSRKVIIFNNTIIAGTILFISIMCALCGIFGDNPVSAASVISISTAQELMKIGTDSAYPMDGDYILTADINLSGKEWLPIGGKGQTDGKANYIGVRGCDDPYYPNVFSGTFDGRGHVISGMTIDVSGSVDGQNRNCGQIGLFSIIASSDPSKYAVVKNIILSDVDIRVDFDDGYAAVGSLAGEVNGYATVDNVAAVNGTIVANPSAVCDTVGIGGVIGECRTASQTGNGYINVSNIYNGVDVIANGTRHDYMYAAGIIGRVAKSKIGRIYSCLNVGSILYDGFLAYPVLSPELGNITYLSNISGCYFLEETARCFGSESTEMTAGALSSGNVPERMNQSVWIGEKGCYPVPELCLKSSAAGIIYIEGLNPEYAYGESQKHVKTEIILPDKVGEDTLTWSSDNPNLLRIDGNKAIAVTSQIGADTVVYLSAVSGAGYKKQFKLTLIPDVYIKARFNNNYAEVGKELKVIVDNPAGYEYSYEWQIDGKTIEETTDAYIPTESDLESFITVIVRAKEADMEWKITTYLSELPVIYIDTDDGKPVTSNYSTKNANIRVQGNSEFNDLKNLYEGRTTIKGRGNSTWSEAVSMGVKKPYKLKLETKCNLLGISGGGKNKHWVLLANMIDHTNMRNEITHNFSKDMGLDCAMASTGVVLILNGEYEGMYQLSEHVRVGSSRVNVYDWEGLAEDIAAGICKENIYLNQERLEDYLKENLSFITTGVIDYNGKRYTVSNYYTGKIPDITGGYLLGMDFRSPHDSYKYPSSFISSNTIPMYIDTPEFAKSCPEMMKYVENYINAFENGIKGNDYITDYEGRDCHYSELFDVDSLVSYWYVCELTNNWDSMKNSTYMYKDIEGKIYMGPAWDYDWGYGNICMYNCGSLLVTDKWQTELSGTDTNQGGFGEQSYQKYQWNRYLVKDPYFVMKLYKKYKETRPTVFEDLIKEGGVLDTYHKKYATASVANDEKWSFSYENYKGYAFINGEKKHVTSQLYEPAFESFKTFVKRRIAWFDKQFESLDRLYTSLGNTISDETNVIVSRDGEDGLIAKVTTSNDKALYAEIIVNGRRIENEAGEYMYALNEGAVEVRIPSDLISREDTDNMVQAEVFASTYRLVDNKVSYTTFEYDNSTLGAASPTKTPRPSGVPAPSLYPVATDTPKPTRVPRPTSEPTATPEPVMTGQPPVTQQPVIITTSSPEPKVKASLSVKGKKVVKRGKSIKLTATVKGVSGKIKWKTNSKGKKLIRFRKTSGKSVTVVARNKKGKATVTIICGKLSRKILITVK